MKSNRKAICEIEDGIGSKKVGQVEVTNSFVKYYYDSLGTSGDFTLTKEILEEMNFVCVHVILLRKRHTRQSNTSSHAKKF